MALHLLAFACGILCATLVAFEIDCRREEEAEALRRAIALRNGARLGCDCVPGADWNLAVAGGTGDEVPSV